MCRRKLYPEFSLVCVTSRKHCSSMLEFLKQVELLSSNGISQIILREKDLPGEAYESLAKQVLAICSRYGTPLVINHFTEAAFRLGVERVQVSMAEFRRHPTLTQEFSQVGVSIHAVEEALEAWRLGADFLVAGHIFPTDCKKGLPGRGTDFLENIVRQVPIPVYGIGGITGEKLPAIKETGAAGVCMMSTLMRCSQEDFLDIRRRSG